MTTLNVVTLIASVVFTATSWTLFFLTRRNVNKLRQALREERAVRNPNHTHITMRPGGVIKTIHSGPSFHWNAEAERASRLWPAGPDVTPPPADPPPPPPASGGRHE